MVVKLQMHLKMSYTEVYNLPVRYRKWYVDRLVKYFEERNERAKNSVKPNNNINADNKKGFDLFQEMIDNKFVK